MKPGDIVVLRSGSPMLTVEAIKDNKIVVIWHDKNSGICQAVVSEHVLRMERALSSNEPKKGELPK